MSALDARCPHCHAPIVASRFDATFRMEDRSERLCFGIPAAMCSPCQQLLLDPAIVEMLDLPNGRCVFAIESDAMVRARTASTSGRPASTSDLTPA